MMMRQLHQKRFFLPAVMITVVMGSLGASSSSAKVLFLAHYNDSTANADYAVGSPVASGAGIYAVAGTTGPGLGKWGRGLDQRTDGDGRCAYQGLDNLDPLKGTADFWFVLDDYYPTINVQPVFGWFNPPNTSGTNAFYVHLSGISQWLSFNFLDPDPAIAYISHEALYLPVVGQWYHMEINWDCTGGNGNSTYNVYIDGQNIVRKTGLNALGSPGGEIRVGIWGFFEGLFIHGRIDELRITDQIEHLSNFTPSIAEYENPETPAGIATSYVGLLDEAISLEQEISDLSRIIEITQWTAESCPAAVVRSNSLIAAQTSTNSLESLGGQMRQAFINSTGPVAYAADFEGWNATDLTTAPWSNPGFNASIVTTGLGANTSDVVQVGFDAFAWLEPDTATQFAQGTLEFDALLNGASGFPSFILYVADDPGSIFAIYWRVAEESGAGGIGLDLYDYGANGGTGGVVLTDFMSKDVDTHFKIDFDAVAGTVDFYVDGVAKLTNHPSPGAFTEVNRIAWYNAAGYYVQIDNVSLSDGNILNAIQDTLVGSLTVTAAPGDPPPPNPDLQGWFPGDTPPAYWTIDTLMLNPFDSIDFTAPLANQYFDSNIDDTLRKLYTSGYSNSDWARVFQGGSPAFMVDSEYQTIELFFQSPVPPDGGTACSPVSGLQGSIGSLGHIGDWLLFSGEPGALFSLPFYVSPDISGPSGLPDCEVNYFDFASLANGWQSSFTLADLQQVIDDWLSHPVGCP
jgi:hypothetical protein